MGAIPVNFPEFKKCYFAFKYGRGSHLEFRHIGKMPGIFKSYLGAKILQKGPKKGKMLTNNVSQRMVTELKEIGSTNRRGASN